MIRSQVLMQAWRITSWATLSPSTVSRDEAPWQSMNNASTIWVQIRGSRCCRLSAVADVHYIPVLDDVVFAFQAERTLGAGVGFRTRLQ